jgi:hypothetical protein
MGKVINLDEVVGGKLARRILCRPSQARTSPHHRAAQQRLAEAIGVERTPALHDLAFQRLAAERAIPFTTETDFQP